MGGGIKKCVFKKIPKKIVLSGRSLRQGSLIVLGPGASVCMGAVCSLNLALGPLYRDPAVQSGELYLYKGRPGVRMSNQNIHGQKKVSGHLYSFFDCALS